MTLDEMVKKLPGKQVEVAGSANAKYQCVDLANLYIRDVLKKPIIEWTNAKDFPSKAGDSYDYLRNTPEFIPQKGDIAIWNGRVGGGAGHIAIVLEDADINTFESLDQNWSVPLYVTVEGHTYTNVSGFLRSKEIMSDALQACLAQHKQLVDETIALKKVIENMKSEAEAVKTDIDNMRREYEEKLKLKDVQLEGLLRIETLLQQEKDGRREDSLKFEMTRLDLEGTIEKLKQQIASEDLSLRDYKLLVNALMKKVLRYIESLKK